MARLLPAFFLIFSLSSAVPSMANTTDDMFMVKSVKDGQAILSGLPKGLKPGDTIYFIRYPYQFQVITADDAQIVIKVPLDSDLAVGNTLIRRATDSIKKAIQKDKALNSALGTE